MLDWFRRLFTRGAEHPLDPPHPAGAPPGREPDLPPAVRESLRALDVVVESRADPDYLWLQADPDVIYPKVINAIRLAVDEEEIPSGLAQYYHQALTLDDEAWRWALTPRGQCPDAVLAARAEALELARRWFTAQLHAELGGRPIGVHWLKRSRWRQA